MNKNDYNNIKIDSLLNDLPNTINKKTKNIEAGYALMRQIENKTYNSTEYLKANKSHNIRRIFAYLSSLCISLALAFLIINSQNLFFVKYIIQKTTLNNTVETIPFKSRAASGIMQEDISGDLNLEYSDALVITADNSYPVFQSAWYEGGNMYPFICINDKVFRLLSSKCDNGNIIGNKLGIVQAYAELPFNSDTSISSNYAVVDEEIYSVNNMEGTLIALAQNNEYSLFQRVSYSNVALIGKETLKDVFNVNNNVISINLSGVGNINTKENSRLFINEIIQSSKYISANDGTTFSNTMQIVLENGITLQLMIDNNSFACCGEYYFPNLYDTFISYMQ